MKTSIFIFYCCAKKFPWLLYCCETLHFFIQHWIQNLSACVGSNFTSTLPWAVWWLDVHVYFFRILFSIPWFTMLRQSLLLLTMEILELVGDTKLIKYQNSQKVCELSVILQHRKEQPLRQVCNWYKHLVTIVQYLILHSLLNMIQLLHMQEWV